VQNGDKLIAAFNGGVCGMVIATKTPSSDNGACVVTFDHGENPDNPPGGFADIVPNLTTAEMDAAQVYDLGNGNIDTLQFSVVAGTASTPGSLQLAVGGGTPALFAAGIDDLQVLFGYNTSGGQSVTSYGYYDPTYAADIRTVTIAMVAQSKIQTPGTVTPTQILVIPAVPASQSLTGAALPAIYYQPPTGVTNEEFNLMTTTVPVMNLIWH
jgi:type IV pilus assembly protein PilW